MTDTQIETSTEQASTEQASTGRVFYRSDYRHMARVLQDMRHVRGDRYTGKPEAAQQEVTALALTIGQAFEADAAQACEGCGFDFGKFMAGTDLQAKPVYGEDEDPETLAEV